jgi:hypothetical protein
MYPHRFLLALSLFWIRSAGFGRGRRGIAPSVTRGVAGGVRGGGGSQSAGRACAAHATATHPGRHLLAAFDQQRHVVLAQRAVDAKTNEIAELKALLGGVDLAGAASRWGVPNPTRSTDARAVRLESAAAFLDVCPLGFQSSI